MADIEKIICERGGFVGAYMDEPTIGLLETKLAERNRKTRIFYIIAVDRDTGSQTLIVPEERIEEAKSYAREIDAWNEVGARKIEEVEPILITRFQPNSGPTDVVKHSEPPQDGTYGCITVTSTMRSKK